MTTQEAYQLLFTSYPDVVNVHQMCEILGINIKTAYKLLKCGEIRSIYVANKYRIPKIEIFRYLGLVKDYDDKRKK